MFQKLIFYSQMAINFYVFPRREARWQCGSFLDYLGICPLSAWSSNEYPLVEKHDNENSPIEMDAKNLQVFQESMVILQLCYPVFRIEANSLVFQVMDMDLVGTEFTTQWLLGGFWS